MDKFRWGIMATGNIAHSLAQTLTELPEAEIVAVGSRSQEQADAFGVKWQIPKRYPSYEMLAADPDVEVVYIATPHNLHYENMLMCLEAGKHVLCEKAFTINAQQAIECVQFARNKNLFLMEAMWMRYFPVMGKIRDWLQEEVLGELRLVQADFCINIPYDPEHRLYNPAIGGGALLDLGIYPLSFASMILGQPQQMLSHAHIGQTEVDELDTILLIYDRGVSASLSCSMRIHKPREAFIVGSRGYIKVPEIFFRPDRVTLHLIGQEPENLYLPFEGNGYNHEVREVHQCLLAGKLESSIMPLDESIKLMQIMDQLRAEWGVLYPEEQGY